MLSSGATAVCEIVVHALLVTCYSITPDLSSVYYVSQSWVLARLGLVGPTWGLSKSDGYRGSSLTSSLTCLVVNSVPGWSSGRAWLLHVVSLAAGAP